MRLHGRTSARAATGLWLAHRLLNGRARHAARTRRRLASQRRRTSLRHWSRGERNSVAVTIVLWFTGLVVLIWMWRLLRWALRLALYLAGELAKRTEWREPKLGPAFGIKKEAWITEDGLRWGLAFRIGFGLSSVLMVWLPSLELIDTGGVR